MSLCKLIGSLCCAQNEKKFRKEVRMEHEPFSRVNDKGIHDGFSESTRSRTKIREETHTPEQAYILAQVPCGI